MAIHIGKETSVGFKVQAAKGSYLAPDVWLPHAGEGVIYEPNLEVHEYADLLAHQAKYMSTGQWAAGNLVFPFVPAYTSDLVTWLMTRDADEQGKWASLLIDLVRVVKKLTDAKVTTATVTLAKGGRCDVEVNIVALLYESGSAGSPTNPTAGPFIFKEAVVSTKTGGGAYAADADVESVTINIDNGVEDPAEGMRLRDSYAPLQLYNVRGQDVTGTVAIDFTASNYHADVLAGTEGALKMVLTRGCDVVTLECPRVLWESTDVASPGTREGRIVETIGFRALGSTDGVTAPLAIT